MGSRRLLALLLLCSIITLLIPSEAVALVANTTPDLKSLLFTELETDTDALSQTAGQEPALEQIENGFNDLKLQLGQATILHFTHLETGNIQWTVELQEASAGLLLQVSLLQPQDGGDGQLTELHNQTVASGTESSLVEQVPSGDLMLSLTPKPITSSADAMTDGTIPTITFSLSISGALEANADMPPQITASSPAFGHRVYADVEYVLFEVETVPYYPVYFGTSEQAQAADQAGKVSQTMLLSDGLLNSLQAFTVGPSGHISLVTRTVLRHWLAVDPGQPVMLKRQPNLRIVVPDASLIDLTTSSLLLDGEALSLQASLDQNLVFAIPASPLSYGTHRVQLTLFGQSEQPGGQGQLLDSLAWEFDLPQYRVAEFRPGKSVYLLNQQEQTLDAAPYLDPVSNTTMMPLRILGDIMGAQMDWRSNDQTATFILGDKTVQVSVGKKIALVDGESVPLLAAPANINGRTMVPLRFVSENLGATVNWDPGTGKIMVQVTME